MKVLITGGAGDIGNYVVEELLGQCKLTILDLRKSSRYPELPWKKVNLLDAEAVKKSVKGFDTVIHLAAIPHPFNDPGDKVLHVNVVSTYNLMEAVRHNKVRRVILGCSESASGFGIHRVCYRPLYFPIDEKHPSWPHESYSLSKYFSEIMCQEYSRAYGIETISLRYAWVWLERDRKQIENLLKSKKMDPKNWLGAYIMPEDVAQAFRLALSYRFDSQPPFESFYLTAAETFQKIESCKLIRRVFPENTPSIKNKRYFEKVPRASLFSINKARRKLGFKPTKTWEDFLVAGLHSAKNC